MRRVLIVGCPGAGKSSAARALSNRTGLPVIHLDRHYWLPGWRRPDPEGWRQTVRSLVARPEWIMDGNYSGTLDLRTPVADTLVHFDFPTSVCAWRVLKRTATGFGKPRAEELIDGCPERFDWAFFEFVLRYRRSYRARDLARLKSFEGTYHGFREPSELDEFLANLPVSQQPSAEASLLFPR